MTQSSSCYQMHMLYTNIGRTRQWRANVVKPENCASGKSLCHLLELACRLDDLRAVLTLVGIACLRVT